MVKRKGEMMDDLIWRTDVVNYIEEYGIIDGYEDTQNCIRGIKALPSAQPEIKTDGDTISRRAAIDILYNFAGCIADTLGDWYKAFEKYKYELENLPSALPETNCSEIPNGSDTISRRAAIDAVLKLTYADGAYGYTDAKELVDSLENLPSTQPERKTGRWIKPTGMMPPEHHGHYECSECGAWAMRPWLRPWEGVVLTDFCPACGIPMRKEGDS